MEQVSERLAVHHRLPPVVQGSIIAAVGSSFPELASTVLSTVLHGEFDLGVSIVVGSAIFNILVIPGISGVASGGVRASRRFLYKDALFYISSVLALLLAFSMAVVYHPLPGDSLDGEIDRAIAALPVILYGLYLFIQQQDTLEQREQHLEGSILGERTEESQIDAGKQWLLLGYTLVIIVVGVEVLVRSAIGLGEVFGTPSFLWGLTIIAAVTSLPDAVISLRAARKGEDAVSLANVLGSNIFDLLIAVPAGVFIAGRTRVNFEVAAPLMGFLGVATILLFALLRINLELSVWKSWAVLGLYLLFVSVMIFETIGVVDLIH